MTAADFSPTLSSDEPYLARALQLAQLGTARVFPNPRVGSVIVAEGRIIGEGYHQFAGGPHAEVNAIASVSKADRILLPESTIYVTLEPCSHFGKTPPCADLIIQEKIPEIIVGMIDPNPRVAGRGLKRLLGQGHQVRLAQNPEPFEEINKVFLTNQLDQRPFVSLKWAETEDGFIAKRVNGQPQPIQISGAHARIFVHRLRAAHQAILVGRVTAQQDDPSLTTRNFPGESPLRIILDRTLKLTSDLRVFTDGGPTLVLNEQKNGQDGAVQFFIPEQWDDLNQLFWELYERLGITSILVEGGGKVHNMCLEQRAFDEVHRLTGPMRLGNGVPAPAVPEFLPWDLPVSLGNTRLESVKWRTPEINV